MPYDKKTLPPIPDVTPRINDVHLVAEDASVKKVDLKIVDPAGKEWGHSVEIRSTNVDITLKDKFSTDPDLWKPGTVMVVTISNDSDGVESIKLKSGYWTRNGEKVGNDFIFD